MIGRCWWVVACCSGVTALEQKAKCVFDADMRVDIGVSDTTNSLTATATGIADSTIVLHDSMTNESMASPRSVDLSVTGAGVVVLSVSGPKRLALLYLTDYLLGRTMSHKGKFCVVGRVEEGSAGDDDTTHARQPVPLMARISNANGTIRGFVTLETHGDRTYLGGLVSGLRAGPHGFHIHQYSVFPEGLGTHFQPLGNQHGLPPNSRHLGAMGNIYANDEGDVAVQDWLKCNVGAYLYANIWSGDDKSIVGRSINIHTSEDTGVQPTGNAGPVIASGVIGYLSEGYSYPARHCAPDSPTEQTPEAITIIIIAMVGAGCVLALLLVLFGAWSRMSS